MELSMFLEYRHRRTGETCRISMLEKGRVIYRFWNGDGDDYAETNNAGFRRSYTLCVRTIDDIKALNQRAGRFYFSPDTMRWFKGRVSDTIHRGAGGVFFVHSVKPPHDRREYRVERFDTDTGHVVYPRAGGVYASSAGAHRNAERLATQ